MRIFIITFLLAGLVACNSQKQEGSKPEMQSFGKQISSEGAQPVASVVSLMQGKDSVQAKFTGKIVECCQNKGCWMTMDLGQGEPMRVSFKDYGFFVPKNSGGMNAVIDGWAYRTVTTVEDLRHYAQDEGLSEEEINKITEPKEEITFVAEGVLISGEGEAAPKEEKKEEAH